ncbi:hypothetical protein FOZ63_026022, partial [Perkinsus olseni]
SILPRARRVFQDLKALNGGSFVQPEMTPHGYTALSVAMLLGIMSFICLSLCCALLGLVSTTDATAAVSYPVQHCIDGDKCVNRGLLKIEDGKVTLQQNSEYSRKYGPLLRDKVLNKENLRDDSLVQLRVLKGDGEYLQSSIPVKVFRDTLTAPTVGGASALAAKSGSLTEHITLHMDDEGNLESVGYRVRKTLGAPLFQATTAALHSMTVTKGPAIPVPKRRVQKTRSEANGSGNGEKKAAAGVSQKAEEQLDEGEYEVEEDPQAEQGFLRKYWWVILIFFLLTSAMGQDEDPKQAAAAGGAAKGGNAGKHSDVTLSHSMLYFVICVLGSIALVACSILLLIQALANLMRGVLHLEPGDEVDVVLTGASGGVGQAVLKELLSTQSRVHPRRIHAWDAKAHEKKDDSVELMSANTKITYRQVDVTDEAAVKAGVKAVVESGAKRVIVICNAGVLHAGLTEDISHTNFLATLDVNVASHQLLYSLFLHESLSEGNSLDLVSFVSISSAMAFSASAFLSAYCASKAALVTLHQCMRLENRQQQKHPVRLSVVCPFLVKDSPMFDGAFAHPTLPEKLVLLLCPPLDCSYVAKAIINEAIINGKEVLCLPRWPLAFALLMSALLPTEVYDWITAISGGQVGMVGVMSKAEVHKGDEREKED